MRNEVLDFLGNLPKSKSKQFNQAVGLYRQSKNHNPGQVRFMNTLGFSEDRLEILLYELKKLHNITDLQVASARRKVKEDSEKEALEKEYKLIIEGYNKDLKDLDHNLKELDFENGMLRDTFRLFLDECYEILKPIPAEMIPEEITGKLEELEALCLEKLTLIEVNEEEILEQIAAGETEYNSDTVPDSLPSLSEFMIKEISDELENAPAESSEEESDKEDDNSDPLEDAPVDPSEEFLSRLADFDVSAEKYNDIKSFAAEVSEVTGEDPVDQKSDSLKAFVLAAKKKFQQA